MSPPPSLQILPHPTKRLSLHTTTHTPPAHTIAPFAPLILIPSLSHALTICSHCFSSSSSPSPPRACTRCRAVAYCDPTCQSAAWSAVHARECKLLRRVAEKGKPGLPTPVRAVVQALVVKRIGNGLAGLEGGVDMFRREGGEAWKDMQMMAVGAAAFAGLETTRENVERAMEYLCKIQINAFQRYDAELGHVGIFLEPTLAMANHSCVPNAIVQFIGRNAVLRAEREIGAGEEIEISYTDYTYPLFARQTALSKYHFTCTCPRCEQDLGIYQACALSSNLELNRTSLVSDVAKLREHPATDANKARLVNKYSVDLANMSALEPDETLPSREHRKVLQAQWQRCEPLIREGCWAVSPLAQVLFNIALYYIKEGNWWYALLAKCLVATKSDPYRYAAPFHSLRVKNLLFIANVLTVTADATSLNPSVSSTRKQLDNVDPKVLSALDEMDQTSLCQMLLLMVLKSAPAGFVDEWDLSVRASVMLSDIDELGGREQELSLINAWNEAPESDQSRAFFEYAVVKQIDTLAELGLEILAMEFGR